MIPKRRVFVPKKKETEHRLNRDIRVPEVRLVGEEIEPGVYPIEEALRLAKEQEVDLVEISPNAVPPVCRIVDYKKFLYEKKKKEKETLLWIETASYTTTDTYRSKQLNQEREKKIQKERIARHALFPFL